MIKLAQDKVRNVDLKHIVILIFLFMSLPVQGQDTCYPGLDCPEDIPGYNPPPPPRQQPRPRPRPSPTVQENCSNPFMAMYGALLGQQPTCTQRATHCCFSDGSYVPLQNPGSIPFAGNCFTQTNLFGVMIPVQGLGCRR